MAKKLDEEIVRVERRQHWAVLDQRMLRDSRLSFTARGLLAYVLSRPDGWKVRRSDLASEGGMGRGALYTVLKELILHGYMTRERLKDNRGRFHWRSTVYEEPQLPHDDAQRTRPSIPRGHYLYLVQCGPFVKIGVAERIYQRLAQIRVGNPYDVELLKAVDVGNSEAAYRLEAALHAKFLKHRKQGEWFKLTPTELAQAFAELEPFPEVDLAKDEPGQSKLFEEASNSPRAELRDVVLEHVDLRDAGEPDAVQPETADRSVYEVSSKEVPKEERSKAKEGSKDNETDFVAKLKQNPAYDHIDIDRELHKMHAWLELPANKGRKLTPKFALNWLNKIEAPIEAPIKGNGNVGRHVSDKSPEPTKPREEWTAEDYIGSFTTAMKNGYKPFRELNAIPNQTIRQQVGNWYACELKKLQKQERAS